MSRNGIEHGPVTVGTPPKHADPIFARTRDASPLASSLLPEPYVKEALPPAVAEYIRYLEASRRHLEDRVAALGKEAAAARAHRCMDADLALHDGDADLLALDIDPRALTRTEWRIAALLARTLGEIRTQATILRAVWGPEYDGEGHLLRVNVARVRTKIRGSAAEIDTLLKIGYRMRRKAVVA